MSFALATSDAPGADVKAMEELAETLGPLIDAHALLASEVRGLRDVIEVETQPYEVRGRIETAALLSKQIHDAFRIWAMGGLKIGRDAHKEVVAARKLAKEAAGVKRKRVEAKKDDQSEETKEEEEQEEVSE